jgi:hypothetical protein
MDKKYQYQLDEYAVFNPVIQHKKGNIILYSIFAVITVLYVIDIITDVFGVFNFLIYFLSFFFLMAIPLSRETIYKKECLIVTPKHLIKRVEKNVFKVLTFDNISAFALNDNQIVIKEKDTEVEILVDLYKEDLEVIIDILEAKGKTFDSKKDYMVRPIHITIKDNVVTINDIKQEETYVETLTAKLNKKMKNMTPGFIDLAIFKDGIIEQVKFQKNDLYLHISHLEILDGHPENTTFNSIMVEGALAVFVNVELKEIYHRETNEKGDSFAEVRLTKVNVLKYLEKAVFSEWRFRDNTADLILGVGVGSVKLQFTYESVLLGWNKEK